MVEELWLGTPSEDRYRDLYKGVIQAAAALYQWERGIPSGAEGLYKSSAVYLKKYGPSALGLNVEKMVSGMQNFFEGSKQLIPVLEFEK